MLLCSIAKMQHIFSIKKFVSASSRFKRSNLSKNAYFYSETLLFSSAQKGTSTASTHKKNVWRVRKRDLWLYCCSDVKSCERERKNPPVKVKQKMRSWTKPIVRMQFMNQCTRMLAVQQQLHFHFMKCRFISCISRERNRVMEYVECV